MSGPVETDNSGNSCNKRAKCSKQPNYGTKFKADLAGNDGLLVEPARLPTGKRQKARRPVAGLRSEEVSLLLL
jgi:hypothetical protein